MIQVGFALGTQVNDNIEHRAPRTTDELGFGAWRVLKMHAPERSFLGSGGDIRLRYYWLESANLEFFLAKASRKEAARVIPSLQINDKGTLQFGLSEYHVRILIRVLQCRRSRAPRA